MAIQATLAHFLRAERSSNGCPSHRLTKSPRWELIKTLEEQACGAQNVKMQFRTFRQPIVPGCSLFDVRELHHPSSQTSCSSRCVVSTVVPLSRSALQFTALLFLGPLCWPRCTLPWEPGSQYRQPSRAVHIPARGRAVICAHRSETSSSQSPRLCRET